MPVATRPPDREGAFKPPLPRPEGMALTPELALWTARNHSRHKGSRHHEA